MNVDGEKKALTEDGTVTFKVTKDININVSGTADKVSEVKVTKAVLAGVKCDVTYNNNPFTEGTVVSGDVIIIKIAPEDGYILSNTIVKVDDKTQMPDGGALVAGTEYTYSITITDANKTNIAVSASAEKQYNVQVDNKLDNTKADVEVELNGKTGVFDGGLLLGTDKVLVTVTPKTGFFYDKADIDRIITATGASITGTLDGTVYKAEITRFTEDTTINISLNPGKRKVIDLTNEESNIGNAGLDISKEEIEEKYEELKAAFGDVSTSPTAQAVAEAVSSGGFIALELKVATNGAISSGDIEAIGQSEDERLSLLLPEDIEKGVNLNIILMAVCYEADAETVVASEKVNTNVKITISLDDDAFVDIPKSGVKYYIIRIHNGNAERLECKEEENNKISFESDKFSTYILMYENETSEPTPGSSTEPTPGSSATPEPSPTASGSGSGNGNGGGGIGMYIPSVSTTPAPGTSASPAPSASAAPSASTAPSSTPAPGNTTEPGTTEPGTTEPGTTGTTPVNPPAGTSTPKPDNKDDNNKDDKVTGIKVGKKVTVNNSKYKVTSVKGTRAVQFTNGKKNAKAVVIPATIKVSGKSYKVTSIAKNAFKNNKKLKKVTISKNVTTIGKNAFRGCSNLKNIVIKTKKLTVKKTGANAFKGINKKAVIKVPAKKIKAYKKIVKAKGAGSNVKVRK